VASQIKAEAEELAERDSGAMPSIRNPQSDVLNEKSLFNPVG